MSDRRLLTIAQAAEILQIGTKSVRRRIADGTLPGYKVGPRYIRVDAADVEALLKAIPNAKSA